MLSDGQHTFNKYKLLDQTTSHYQSSQGKLEMKLGFGEI